jgi:hypothetical protein
MLRHYFSLFLKLFWVGGLAYPPTVSPVTARSALTNFAPSDFTFLRQQALYQSFDGSAQPVRWRPAASDANTDHEYRSGLIVPAGVISIGRVRLMDIAQDHVP